MRQDLFQAQKNVSGGWSPDVWPFITPFVPTYAPPEHTEQFWQDKPPIDYTHEREWRVPHDFEFSMDAIAFLVVNTYEDEAKMPAQIKNDVGRENILIMDNYRKVTDLWPWHHH